MNFYIQHVRQLTAKNPLWVFVIFVLILLALFLAPFHLHVCQKDIYTGEKDCPSYSMLSFGFVYADVFLEQHSGAFSVLTAAVIGLFTWQLKTSTDKLWKAGELQRKANNRSIRASLAAARAAQKSANVAREEFIASHRPLFVIHSINLLPRHDNLPPEGQPLVATFVLINAGSGEGRIVSSSTNLEYIFTDDKPWRTPPSHNEFINRCLYRVGAADTVTIKSDDIAGEIHWSEEALGPWEDPTRKRLYFYGWILYEDARNGRRTFYFCRVYDRDAERFIPIDDPDANSTY